MKVELNSNEEVRAFIKEHALTTPEAAEILGVQRARISAMISQGKLHPIKKLAGVSIFLKEDIELRKNQQDILRKKFRPYDE